MGAVSAILFARTDPRLAALVCDSAFADLPLLIEEMVAAQQETPNSPAHRVASLPSFLVRGGLRLVASSIEERADLNLYDLTPVKDVAYMRVPVFILHGVRDTVVRVSHAQALFDNYGGKDKTLLKVDQGHNTPREATTNEQICKFIVFRLTGNLADYAKLLGNAATSDDEDREDDSGILVYSAGSTQDTL
jgi:pimeloyl-ACP methyl ester carboxylesterase